MFPIPTVRTAALIALIALVGLVPPWRGALVVANLVLGGLAFVDWVTALLAARRIGIHRIVPVGVSLGGEATISWEVDNPLRTARVVELSDDLVDSLRCSHRRVRLRAPGEMITRADAIIRPARRGLFVFEEITVRVAGVAGLVAVQRRRKVPGELRVLPAFPSRSAATARVRRLRVVEPGRFATRVTGGSAEFDHLRDYTVDDQFRRIDWGATARRGSPIVKVLRPESNQTLTVVIDCGRLMAGQVGGMPRMEHAIDAVAALAHLATHFGDRCGVIGFDTIERARVAPSHSRRHAQTILEALFDLEPRLVDTDFTAMVAAAESAFHRRSMLVVLTDLLDDSLVGRLLPAVSLVARRHRLVIAACSDPHLVEWAGADAEGPDAAYLRAATAAALLSRRRTAARLTAAGAQVIDAPPGALADRLLDLYLDAKASGAL